MKIENRNENKQAIFQKGRKKSPTYKQLLVKKGEKSPHSEV